MTVHEVFADSEIHQRFYDRLRERIHSLVARNRFAEKIADFLLLVPDVFILLWRLTSDARVNGKDKVLLGTAIVSRPDTLQFYTDVAHWAAERGILRIFYFRFNGKMVSCELCFEDNHRVYIIKGGIDPEMTQTPPRVGSKSMPVIPPPGSSGSKRGINPK